MTDQQGAAIPGVTVSVTSLTSGETRTFLTDINGQFLASDLNPGRYKVLFELAGFTRVERPDVSVALGRTFEVNTEMSVGGVTETVQVTAEASPLVDNRSTLIAHNVSAEEFDRLPKGRSFQSIALTAPSVNSGEVEGGFQVNGASGAENGFTVDGITTNSLINGQSRQNTVFEYLQEVQVKTSGISAEYGGALGGVISAVTKSGGNVFRGEGHYYYEGSALAVGPVERLVLEPSTRAPRSSSRTTRTRAARASSADRSAARSSRTGCSSSVRIRRASRTATISTTSPTAAARSTTRSGGSRRSGS